MLDRGWQRWFVDNWGYLVAALLAVLVYLPAVGGGPIWDDVIVYERYLPAFGGLGDALLPPAGTGELGLYYYRPLVTASYLFDRWLAGGGAYYVDHLSVMLWHALTAVGVGLFATRLLANNVAARLGGFVAAWAFAVHPVHVDSVAQITGRCDPMAGAFMVGSALCVMLGRDRPRLRWPWYAASVTLLLGLFSKEVAVMSIPLGAILLLAPSRAPTGMWRRLGLAYGAAALLYLLLRTSAPLADTVWLEQSFAEAVHRLVRAIGYDLRMLVLPWPQAAFVAFASFDSMLGIVGSVAGQIAVGLAMFASWRARAGGPILVVGLFWLVLTLLPALAVLFVKVSEQPVAERYLYVPSVGLCLALGWLVAWAAARDAWRKPAVALTVVLLGSAALQTAMRAGIYRDTESFWLDTVAKAPQAPLPRYQLGVHYRKQGELARAREHLEWALAHYDDAEGRSLAHNTLGTIHLEQRDLERAEQSFKAAVAERPDYASPWFNLAGVYRQRAQARRGPGNAPDRAEMERCVHALERAIAARSDYQKARVQLAQQSLELAKVYLALGRREDALARRDRARAAAEWLIRHYPGPAGDLGRRIVTELGSIR